MVEKLSKSLGKIASCFRSSWFVSASAQQLLPIGIKQDQSNWNGEFVRKKGTGTYWKKPGVIRFKICEIFNASKWKIWFDY